MKPSLDACEDFKKFIRDYQWTADKDQDMIRMFVEDRKDFRKVLSFYKKGQWKEAAEFTRHMDTAAREFIPDKIWEDIQSV